jgi:thioredoxin reductase
MKQQTFWLKRGRVRCSPYPEEAPMILQVVDWSIRKMLLERLGKKKIKILAGVKQLGKTTPKGMQLTNNEGGKVFFEADSIMIAAGARPDQTLAQSLKGKVPELYEVGDCVEARRLLDALHEGAEAALNI